MKKYIYIFIVATWNKTDTELFLCFYMNNIHALLKKENILKCNLNETYIKL